MTSAAAALVEELGWDAFRLALRALPSLSSWVRGVIADAEGDDPIADRIRSILPAQSESETAAEEIRAQLAAKASP